MVVVYETSANLKGRWNSKKKLGNWMFHDVPILYFYQILVIPKKVKWGSALAKSTISWYFHHPWSDQDNFGAGSPGPWRWFKRKLGPIPLHKEDCSNKTSEPSQEFLLYWTKRFSAGGFFPHPQSKYTTWKVDTHWLIMAPYKNPQPNLGGATAIFHYSVTGWTGKNPAGGGPTWMSQEVSKWLINGL